MKTSTSEGVCHWLLSLLLLFLYLLIIVRNLQWNTDWQLRGVQKLGEMQELTIFFFNFSLCLKRT